MTHPNLSTSAEVVGPPAIAHAVFGTKLPIATRYAQWLAGAGVERGLIGPHEAERLWSRHLVNCVAVAALIPRDSHVIDVGSGAGLPGVVLAIARPDLMITLVEPMQRRIDFLNEVCEDLSLTQVTTQRVRADDLASAALNADVVTARAVAPVDRLAALAAPLLRAGGHLLAVKGSSVGAEVRSGWDAVRRAGMTSDAALLAVYAAEGDSSTVVDADRVQGPDVLLPGVQIAELSTWQVDGILCEGEAAKVTPSTDPLALVLRLGRAGRLSLRRQ